MACYHPIPASQEGSEPPRLWPPMGTANLALPCGKCIGCRTDRATHWANRCTHEASTWDHNSFLTLTYDDEHLPAEAHLSPRQLQLFIKRLRKHADSPRSSIDRDRSASLRYLACGEYGEQTRRPHYHALIFNGAFRDRRRCGKDLFDSDTLRSLWPYGDHKIGDVTPAAAAYVAQYNLKKQGAGDHDADGVWRPAPFLRMSLRPAIGATWLTAYAEDLSHGYLVQDGRKHSIPRYYRDKIKETLPDLRERIQLRIEQHRIHNTGDQKSPNRLHDSETIHTRRKELRDQRSL